MAMTSQEIAGRNVHLLDVARTHRLVLRTLEDVTDEELQRSPIGGLSPIVWQVGHLASADASFARQCGARFAPDAAFEALFGRRTGGPRPYPSLAEIRPVFEAAHDALVSVVRSADLTAPLSGEFFKSVADVISFACFHRGYHIGKICTLRALLGKPRLFD